MYTLGVFGIHVGLTLDQELAKFGVATFIRKMQCGLSLHTTNNVKNKHCSLPSILKACVKDGRRTFGL